MKVFTISINLRVVRLRKEDGGKLVEALREQTELMVKALGVSSSGVACELCNYDLVEHQVAE